MPERGQRLWRRVFRISRYHAFAVLAATAVIAGFALWYTHDVPLRSSVFDLLPRNDPLIEAYRQNEPYLAQTDTVVVLLTLLHPEGKGEGERKSALLSAAAEIAQTLRQDPELKKVTYLIEPSPEIPDQYLLLYRLDPERIARIQASVSLAGSVLAEREINLPPDADLASAYRAAISLVDQTVASGFGGDSAAGDPLPDLIALNEGVLRAIDALGSFPAITSAVHDLSDIFSPSEPVRREGEPLLSRDKTQLLMSAQPRRPSSTGVGYCAQVAEAVRGDLARADLARLGVSAAMTGTYSYLAETNGVISEDMRRTGLITGAGVLLVFLVSFGSLTYSLIAGIPLTISLLLTTVWAKASLGGFNLITTFIPSLILGLGDDFSIHLISRYLEERSGGSSFNRSLFTALWRKGIAVFVGALTIVLVFLGLLTSRSRALFEMGVITSVGVVLTFLCAILLIPALLTAYRFLLRRRRREKIAHHAPHFAGFFRFTTRHSRPIVISVLVLTGLVVFQATKTRFQFSSADLIPHVSSQETLDRIVRAFDLGGQSTQLGTYFLFFAKSEQEMDTLTAQLQENPLVLEVDSARRLLPLNLSLQEKALTSVHISDYADQLALLDRSLATSREVLTEIPALRTRASLIQYATTLNGSAQLSLEAATLQAQFRDIEKALRSLDAGEARSTVQELESALRSLDAQLAQVRQLPPVETLFRQVLQSFPPEVASRFLTPDGRYIIRARMSPQVARGGNLQGFERFAASISSDYFGMALVVKDLEQVMKRDFYLSTLLAIALITFTVWRTFKRLGRTLLGLAPLVLSYVWMLGGMRLLGIDFNFINITISPLLIGIGVDSGVMLLIRYEEERALAPVGAMGRAGTTTIVAILTSVFTTMLVFATLLAARTPGLRYLGTCALLGLGFSLLFSLVFLPAASSLGSIRRAKANPPTTPRES